MIRCQLVHKPVSEAQSPGKYASIGIVFRSRLIACGALIEASQWTS